MHNLLREVPHTALDALHSYTSEQVDLIKRVTGRFYTPETIGHHLTTAILRAGEKKFSYASASGDKSMKVIDPFCGDGRLLVWLLEEVARAPHWRKFLWQVHLWDCDSSALDIAQREVRGTATKLDLKVEVVAQFGDSFAMAQERFGFYDIVIANPPWEVLKPDHRELATLSTCEREAHITQLRRQSQLLTELYPLSAPGRRYSGWGVNLARCGVEAVLRLTASNGICGVVSPASLLADQKSRDLRQWIFQKFVPHDVAHYAAEARLFEGVDQPCVTLVASPGHVLTASPRVTTYEKDRQPQERPSQSFNLSQLESGQAPSFFSNEEVTQLFARLQELPTFKQLEGKAESNLWAGRELDETGSARFLGSEGRYRFVKGRMVKRFGMAEQPSEFVSQDGPVVPPSANFERIAWRDVSRPTQKRRVHATLIPSGWVSGNSLHVAYFRDSNPQRLRALLCILNSFVFEAQIRALLGTAHVSLGAVRSARILPLQDAEVVSDLATLSEACLHQGSPEDFFNFEVRTAQMYGLSRDEFAVLLTTFSKLEPSERAALLDVQRWTARIDRAIPIPPMTLPVTVATSKKGKPKVATPSIATARIPNHYSASLSALDLEMAHSVPPGGNWKNIPVSIPSKRLEGIRQGFTEGKGSRSTYYGRLLPEMPAYTISTYFGRPGNGCHLHYDPTQHRVLSQREAARLQSFPDSFAFSGSRAAVSQQIGNAVPPLLAYRVARSLGKPGCFVDIFCGAGGLSLGFMWAGWTPIVANDVSSTFLETYAQNIHSSVIPGDIREPSVFDELVSQARSGRAQYEVEHGRQPLFVLGGPPCQGFSTAGNRRSLEDERIWLFDRYRALLDELKPDGFVFENVTGILNMEGGRVFDMIREQLRPATPTQHVWKLRAEEHGIPQRRTRVFIVGSSLRYDEVTPPQAITQLPGKVNNKTESTLFDDMALARLPAPVSVYEALSDLPQLVPGEDGSAKDYLCRPATPYQRLMRGVIQAEDYISSLKANCPGEIGS